MILRKSGVKMRVPYTLYICIEYYFIVRELENTVRDLREALEKRFPDSISNLLHATAAAGIGADPAELERTQSEVGRLKQEIEEISGQSERKILGLRQNFEKLRLGYEERIRELESLIPSPNEGTAKVKVTPSATAVARRAVVSAADVLGKPWSSNKLDPTKNLSQALARIR